MIVTRTPLRVSLLGGGSDFPEFYCREPGCVLAAAIDKYVYVTLNRRYDDRIRLSYTRTQTVSCLSDLRHELVRESLRHVGIASGVEVATLADIPTKGTGLGSSSTLTVGLLNAFWTYLGVQPTPAQLAEAACDVEIGRLERPIGKQDQYLAAYGGLRLVTFTPEGVTVEDAVGAGDGRQAEELVARLLLFYTGDARRAMALLSAQRSAVESRRRQLRALAQLAREGREALQRGTLDVLGELMAQGWELKKQLADGITNRKINRMVELAMRAGAIGAKVTGAGGRGYLLLYVPPDRQAAVREALHGYRELRFGLDTCGSSLLLDARPSAKEAPGPAVGRGQDGGRARQ